MSRPRLGLAVLFGCVLGLSSAVIAQQPYAVGDVGFGPTGVGYSGFGYSVPGPRGLGYYTGLPEIPYYGGQTAYYSPIFSSLNARPGPDPNAHPIFSGPAPSAKLRARLASWIHKKDEGDSVPSPRGPAW